MTSTFKMIEYKIDDLTAYITKEAKGYKVVSISYRLPRRVCNMDCVSNVAYFPTIKACKAHADELSCLVEYN